MFETDDSFALRLREKIDDIAFAQAAREAALAAAHGKMVDFQRRKSKAILRKLDEQPEWLKGGKLRDYQLEGLNFLVNRGQLHGLILSLMFHLRAERSFICNDTGSLIQEPPKRFQTYKNEDIKFSVEELSEIKKVGIGSLRLLGFKPLSCLKDYYNLKPSTFVFPSDEEVIGSTCIFIALHRSMISLKRFAVAFYGSSSCPQLVALIAQIHATELATDKEPWNLLWTNSYRNSYGNLTMEFAMDKLQRK
ncbi:hypothetical protein LXL04_019346 [Taraxacum kok-saghyz]